MRYLSPEWISAADTAVRAAAASAPAGDITIDQTVEGVVRYRIRIAGDTSAVQVIDESADDADARFTQTLETATAVATGATDAHQAFLLGQIRFEGAVDVLIERRDVLDWLQTTLAPLMAETDFG